MTLPGPQWGRFGDNDNRGALNYITPEKILSSLSLVKRGQVIALNRAVTDPPARAFGRAPMKRTVRLHNSLRPFGDRFLVINDDRVEIEMHGTSHWDAFSHFGAICPGEDGVFYGGAGIEETLPDARARTLGIDAYRNGIVSRGVLLDVVRTVGGSQDLTLPEGHRITGDEIEATLERQNVVLGEGDIALVYTGFQHRYGEIEKVGGGAFSKVAGVDGSTLPIWVERKIAALVSDNLAVDALPTDQSMHIGALRNHGIPLGELWALDELADICRADGQYDFLLVSAPLNIPGGFGSPANALALR